MSYELLHVRAQMKDKDSLSPDKIVSMRNIVIDIVFFHNQRSIKVI